MLRNRVILTFTESALTRLCPALPKTSRNGLERLTVDYGTIEHIVKRIWTFRKPDVLYKCCILLLI